MSERVILNKSFNKTKNECTIYIIDDIFYAEYNKKGIETTKSLDIHKAKGVEVLNAKCPSPSLRKVPYIFEMLALVMIICALASRVNKYLATGFVAGAAILFIVAAIITKIIMSKAADAVEIYIYSDDLKMRILGCNTTSKEQNAVIRIAKECKRINKNMYMDIRTKK